jgi:hypothetical protein
MQTTSEGDNRIWRWLPAQPEIARKYLAAASGVTVRL